LEYVAIKKYAKNINNYSIDHCNFLIKVSREINMCVNKRGNFAIIGIIIILISLNIYLITLGVGSYDATLNISFNTALFKIEPNQPLVSTNETTDITNISAKLHGYLIDSGGENCSTWFEWDDYGLEKECAGLIATGSVVKDGRSIFWKNRHISANNQKPRFYTGFNYSYIGIGQSDNICRMGINEEGLAIGNFDISGNVDPDKRWYMSDEATGSEDGDMHYVLGNFSTVYDAAINLAKHGTFTSQLGIVSSEEGKGAIVTLGADGWTNITWVNNTWVALGNAIHCNGDSDIKMRRVREKVNDIIDNQNSSEEDSLLNWRDVTQRFSKDIDSGYGVNSEPYGYVGSYYTSGINPSSARSALIAVCGNSSYDGALNMAWLSFGQTTHLSLFLPLGASYLESSDGIPSNFTDGNGIETFTDVKQAYAEISPNRYKRSRVHDIHNYTFHNENLTFDEYDILMKTIMTCADTSEAKQRLMIYAENAMQTALQGYIDNLTTYSTNTSKSYPHETKSEFNTTISDLSPGAVYYYKAYANNSVYTSNGSQITVMTRPESPTNLFVNTYNSTQINLSWSKGVGAHYTIIKRGPTKNVTIQVYNGTGNSFKDASLSEGTLYFYRLWSFTSMEGEYQYSLNGTSGYNTTDFKPNNTPIFSGIVPVNKSTNITIDLLSLDIIIEDPDGDTFNWTIETSPDIGSNCGFEDNNGSKFCGVFGLNYSTTYTWYVNATDGFGWTNQSYWFNTMSTDNDVVWVDDDYNNSTPGWGYTHFNTIQNGVNAVDVDGTVYVLEGVYYENIFLYKRINLIGENKDNTVIDGKGYGNVVLITVNGVNMSNFTIKNSGGHRWHSGIKIFSQNNTIQKNILQNHKWGIHLIRSNNNTISENIILNNKHGIHLIRTRYNRISKNHFSNNRIGLCLSYRARNNTIIGNSLFNNRYGLYIWYFNSNNILFHNNFIYNSQNAYDKSSNLWDNGYPSGGNYWDDYGGQDIYHGPNQDIISSDGIGDTPYNISGRAHPNQDHYPLMYQWPWIPGDLDHDNDVDFDDLILFLEAFDHSVGDPEYNPEADYDGDGTITLVDFQIWLQYYHDFYG